jgi:glycosyltransferase involved in cell wall biosynthesis
MRILALNFNLKGLGTYRRSFYFSRELARAGHEVTMVTVSRTSRFKRCVSWKQDWIREFSEPRGDGPWVRLIEGPAWGYRALPGWGSGPLDIWQRVRELQTGEYDAVLGFEHHPNISWPVYLTRRSKSFRFVSDWCDWYGGSSNHFHGWKLAHRIDSFLEERIRCAADCVSVTSRVLFDRALSIGIRPEKIVHIPAGAAPDYIVPIEIKQARRQVALPEDALIVAAVRNGDMCREVRILRELLRRVPNAFFLALGRFPALAMSLAERFGIARHIIPTGWVSDEDYPRYLASADVCFCPLEDSRNDRARWPAKVLDYLTAGRATVTNEVGEVADLFQKRPVGVLAGHGSEEFAESIAGLLSDPDHRQELGNSARQVMVQEWDYRLRGPLIAGLMVGA